MTRSNFLKALGHGLRGIERDERKRLLDYYGELFDDKLEEGKTEEEIIAEFGGIDGLKATILADYPGAQSRRNPVGLALSRTGLVLLSPVVFAVAVTLFALVFSLFAVSVAMVLAGLCYIVFSVPVFAVSTGVGVFQIGVCLFCAGLGIFLFFGSIYFKRFSMFAMKSIFRLYSYVFGKEAA